MLLKPGDFELWAVPSHAPFDSLHTVVTVPPSILYSVPVIEAARGEARKATSSATSLGRAGVLLGCRQASPSEVCVRSRSQCRSWTPIHSPGHGAFCLNPTGRNPHHANAFRAHLLGQGFAVVRKRGFRGSISDGSLGQRHDILDGGADEPPRTWTMMSMPLRRSRTAWAIAVQPSAVVMSAVTNKLASSRSSSLPRVVLSTLAPASRSRFMTAWPTPLVPPVTRTRLPSNSRGTAVKSCAVLIFVKIVPPIGCA
jgi:hypothetical protein